jgi:peptide/nickel transport system substrate-binding protein
MTARFSLLILMFLLTACASSSIPAAPSAGQTGQPTATTPARPLAMLVGKEPVSLSLKPLGQAGSTIASSRRLFNATLVLIDANGGLHPYLAESLPQLNTDSWRVSADGRMETTYPLRPNLTWHDGAPLTAEDFVFGWRMYAEQQLGLSTSTPFNTIEEVVAPDARTVLIRWKRPFPLAGSLTGELPAVPHHILQAPFEQLQAGTMAADAFIRQPFWSTEFVGAGPYKLDRWDSGVSLEGVAFDQHVLGRPKIERITVGFSSDQNATLARMMAGYADYVSDAAIASPQALLLKREWAPTRGGTVMVKLDYFRGAYAQLRPEQASPSAILDVRVRQALSFAVDRQALQDGMDGFEGGNIHAEGPFIPPTASYFPQVDRAITKYPLDLARSAQLMSEAGLTKGADGFYQSPTEVPKV